MAPPAHAGSIATSGFAVRKLDRKKKRCVAWLGICCPGGARLAATVGDSLVVWGDRCRELLRAPHRAAFLGDRLVVLTDAGAYVWDAASCERVLALDGAGFSADHVVASGALVAACGPSGAAVWDARTGRRLRASAGASAGASPCSVAAGPVESMGEALASHV